MTAVPQLYPWFGDMLPVVFIGGGVHEAVWPLGEHRRASICDCIGHGERRFGAKYHAFFLATRQPPPDTDTDSDANYAMVELEDNTHLTL